MGLLKYPIASGIFKKGEELKQQHSVRSVKVDGTVS